MALRVPASALVLLVAFVRGVLLAVVRAVAVFSRRAVAAFVPTGLVGHVLVPPPVGPRSTSGSKVQHPPGALRRRVLGTEDALEVGHELRLQRLGLLLTSRLAV